MKNCLMNISKNKTKNYNENNNIADNMSTEIKLTKAQISKILQSGESFGSCIGNLGKKITNKCCYSFL